MAEKTNDEKGSPVEQQRLEQEQIEDLGSIWRTRGKHAIHCLTVVGQVEGHVEAPQGQKTTKYEHVIPQLVAVQEDPGIEGLLVLLNTVGGDVEAGPGGAHCQHLQAQRRRGAGRRALHWDPAGGERPAELYCAHGHHDHPPGAPFRHDFGRAPDHAVV